MTLRHPSMLTHTKSQRHPPESFDNIHQGRPGFLIGGGPSLRPYLTNASVTSWLQTQITFGANRAYEWFAPTYLAVCDKWFLNTYEKQLKELPCLLFVSDNIQQSPWKNMVIFYKDGRNEQELPASLRYKISCSNNTGTTALRLLAMMGCNPLYLLGVDLREPSQNISHFHSGYGPKRMPSAQRLKNFEDAYRKTLLALNNKNIACFSCSAVSPLNNLIPFKKLETVYEEYTNAS